MIMIEEIRRHVSNFGFELLSEEFKDWKSKIILKCPRGHIFDIRFDSFKSGNRCRFCSNAITFKFTYDYVNSFIEEEGYKLLSKEYKNASTKLLIECPVGHEFKMTFSAFKNSNHRCKFCQKDKSAKKLRHDFSFVENEFSKKGYLLLEQEYINNKQLLKYICSFHPNEIKQITFASLYNHDSGCKQCADEERGKLKRLNTELVFNKFREKGVEPLVDQEYKSVDCKIKFICNVHPDLIQENTYSNILNKKHACAICSRELISGENAWNWQGGITDERRKIMNTLEYKNWRIQVFTRDNYTCQCCGDSKGGNLQAHHIENFSSNKDKRFNVDNGITLCENCHNPSIKDSFHNIYGTRNNTREQLDEYIRKLKIREITKNKQLLKDQDADNASFLLSKKEV